MSDRERLMELITKEVPRPKADALAYHLLANGVIVPVRCENCDYYIPKAILTDEYDNPLGYDGVCDNCDKYTDKDDFCSCAKLKECEQNGN
jgi:hypothetical protein